jgi:ATP-binding cassette subfamily B (MDR/TAP) protein 1
VEQGSHDELVKNSDGVYHNLVHAQQIIMGDGHNDLEPEKETISESLATRADAEKDAVAQDVELDEVPYKQRDFFQSFGLLVLEQKRQIPWLLLTLLGSLGASGKIPNIFYLQYYC